jgi:hypothetical protein
MRVQILCCFEKTALQVVIEDRRNVLILSPICTPELAGGGLEYAWGKLKYEHRKEENAAKDKLSEWAGSWGHRVFRKHF